MKGAEDYLPCRAWISKGYVIETPGAAINKRQVALDLARIA